MAPGDIVKDLLKGAMLDVNFPGFPTMKHLPIMVSLYGMVVIEN